MKRSRRDRITRRCLDSIFGLSGRPRIFKGGRRNRTRAKHYGWLAKTLDLTRIETEEWECTSDTSSESEG
jgi:hypothetical protein